jgi:hypothetical protein
MKASWDLGMSRNTALGESGTAMEIFKKHAHLIIKKSSLMELP